MNKFDVLNEARAIDKLFAKGKHKNLVTVIVHGWLANSTTYYIDMEFCEATLEAFIEGKFPEYFLASNGTTLSCPFTRRNIWNIWGIMEQLANGLRFIHSCKEVHRDLKPRNGDLCQSVIFDLLVLYSVPEKAWKLADFGLTTEGTSKRAHTTERAQGTACYRAPELVREYSRYTNRVDIFALGCILFELVASGQKAFASDFEVLEYASLRSKIDLPPNITYSGSRGNLSHAIRAMLAIEPSARPSANQLRTRFGQNRRFALGEECQRKKDYPAAARAYAAATEIDSSNGLAWKLLGDSHKAAGNYDDALKAYSTAIARKCNDWSVYADTGSAFYARGQKYDSLEMVSIERFTPEPSGVSAHVRHHISMTDYNSAVCMFQEAIKLRPDIYSLFEKLGKAYYAKREFDSAINAYTQGIRVAGTATASLTLALKQAREARQTREVMTIWPKKLSKIWKLWIRRSGSFKKVDTDRAEDS